MILTQMLMPSVEARHGRYSTVVISLTLVVTVIGGCRYCTARGQAIGDQTTLTLASVVASLPNTSSMSVLVGGGNESIYIAWSDVEPEAYGSQSLYLALLRPRERV